MAKGGVSIIQEVAGFRFAPLVTERLRLFGGLRITMLRPEAPGSIVTQGGDIDNRIKTLLDALRMPKGCQELPRNDAAKDGEDPFFCVLEDDNLITEFSVVTDRLLEPCEHSSLVVLLVHVNIKAVVRTFANINFA